MGQDRTIVAERIELLKSVPLFADCNKGELTTVAERAHEQHMPSGTVIVKQGSRGDQFFVLAEGLAYVHVNGHRVASIGAGSFFGEMALIENSPRSATVTAELPVRLLVIDEKDFDKVRSIPSISRKVITGMSQRLRAANEAS